MPDLILASSSPYRRELLTRLHLPFESASPDISRIVAMSFCEPRSWSLA
ncbi:Maf family protein, partial [Pseudomonas aeruginosa]